MMKYDKNKLKRLAYYDPKTHGVYALEDAVEVFGDARHAPDFLEFDKGVSHQNVEHTHRALLINVEPIKRETREEKLERILRQIIENHDDEPHITELWHGDYKDAKAVLGDKDE